MTVATERYAVPPLVVPPAQDGRVKREFRADLQNQIGHSDRAQRVSELVFLGRRPNDPAPTAVRIVEQLAAA